MEKTRTTLQAPRPFSLKATALSHGWHECAPMSWSEAGGSFQVIERIGERVYRVGVVQGRQAARSVPLHVTIESSDIERRDVAVIRDRLRVILALDQDLTAFYALCRDHPTLHVLKTIGAGRTIRSVCMVENVVKMLFGTNVTWTQAVKMINRLAQLGPIVPHFRGLSAWPTPREILRAGRSYLIDVCRVGYRADSVLALCKDVCSGRFDPVQLDRLAASRETETDELIARLRAIRGIGPSSAHALLSFLGRHERLSIDTSTVAHVARTHTNGRKPSLKRIETIYARYGPWKNKVWWFEQWLTWGTARQILRDARIAPS